MRKICVVTGTRAEFGILSHLMHLINECSDLQLQIVATNMHLSPEFGLTYQEIEKEGFTIDKKVYMLLSSDTENATVKSIGLATMGFADAYEELVPDMLLILGDRYEMLAAVTAALIYKIPVAHLHGGEVTEGAYDDAIRHAITKMSHLHFTSTEEYRKRVIQMGENPERVFNVGALGVENVFNAPLLTKEELEESMGFDLGNKFLLVTYHPVTLEGMTAIEQFANLLTVLSGCSGYKLVFTLPNSDTDNHILIRMIEDFVKQNNNSVSFKSLGIVRYLSAMKYASAVIGNSSSGIIEAPSMGVPTLNIGNRQKGRVAAQSIVNCGTTHAEITKGMEAVLSPRLKKIAAKKENPYQKSGTSSEILQMLRDYPLEKLINKSFYDLSCNE